MQKQTTKARERERFASSQTLLIKQEKEEKSSKLFFAVRLYKFVGRVYLLEVKVGLLTAHC